DDGGFTGGNTERPALRRLLTDIENGRIDCCVVYKVDRLSRSLLDFAKLMEVFDRQQVPFVSVTQQFNTGTSMGRLVLNVLLSFAQFEREIISERTSDKMCAARRKGKWVGGPPVLGYNIDREKKRLVIHPEEAEMVRELFDLYLERRSLLEVAKEVNRRGWTTKSWVRTDGTRREGGRFDKAKVQRILTNVTYTGQVRHNGDILPGEHPAIIDDGTFHRVQALIEQNGNGSGKEVRNKHGALLKGILVCGQCGAAMGHTYTKRRNRLYRYYICTTRQKQGREACDTPSLPAQEIEEFVVAQIKRIGQDPELAAQVFDEAIRQQKAQRPRLEKEQRRLLRERQHRGDEIKRLVAVLGSSTEPLASVTKQLAETEAVVACLDQRLAETRNELAQLDLQAIDKDHLTETLAQFEPLWEILTEIERTRLVHLLVELATFDPASGEITLRFQTCVTIR
ncbi:MAG TPA: recombinase family protein, partial [Acidobacteriota bacterium]|nr:recombinase family protein [Acidobacteriota bacterium]